MITRLLLAATGLTFSTAVKRTYFNSREINTEINSKTLSMLFVGLTTLFYMTQAVFSF
ncbi:MAG: hypothetical protein R6V35_02810 [Candidatus Nanohaloarchaea archaeon]